MKSGKFRLAIGHWLIDALAGSRNDRPHIRCGNSSGQLVAIATYTLVTSFRRWFSFYEFPLQFPIAALICALSSAWSILIIPPSVFSSASLSSSSSPSSFHRLVWGLRILLSWVFRFQLCDNFDVVRPPAYDITSSDFVFINTARAAAHSNVVSSVRTSSFVRSAASYHSVLRFNIPPVRSFSQFVVHAQGLRHPDTYTPSRLPGYNAKVRFRAPKASTANFWEAGCR